MKSKTSKSVGGILAISTAFLASTAIASAQSQPASKVTAKVGLVNVISSVSSPSDPNTGPWQTILVNDLKTANKKDLFINPSLEVGLLTETLVRSKTGTSDTSAAAAGVEVRVLVDGVEALPGIVTFGRRIQTLTATFQGIIDGCLEIDPDTGGIVIDEDCVRPEELQLILETMNANSFNFIMADVPAGVHTIAVQARINLGASAQAGSAKARALIGNGSVTVESVRMIRDEDIVLE